LLYGRRLDQALEHVDGSRYALVHAVAKRARQITLWLTADPAELRAEAAPPPAPGGLITRDPVALSEAEILAGEVVVRWDPDGTADEPVISDTALLEADPLLLDVIDDEIELGDDGESDTPVVGVAELDVIEDEVEVDDDEIPVVAEELDVDDIEEDAVDEVDPLEGASLEAMAEEEAALDEDEEEAL
jgi:RNA polymerase Rpb6